MTSTLPRGPGPQHRRSRGPLFSVPRAHVLLFWLLPQFVVAAWKSPECDLLYLTFRDPIRGRLVLPNEAALLSSGSVVHHTTAREWIARYWTAPVATAPPPNGIRPNSPPPNVLPPPAPKTVSSSPPRSSSQIPAPAAVAAASAAAAPPSRVISPAEVVGSDSTFLQFAEDARRRRLGAICLADPSPADRLAEAQTRKQNVLAGAIPGNPELFLRDPKTPMGQIEKDEFVLRPVRAEAQVGG